MLIVCGPPQPQSERRKKYPAYVKYLNECQDDDPKSVPPTTEESHILYTQGQKEEVL